jgi:hypothetical protein
VPESAGLDVLLEQLANINAAYITIAAEIHLGKRFILVICPSFKLIDYLPMVSPITIGRDFWLHQATCGFA